MSRQPKTKVAWAASLALTQGRSTFPSDWRFSLEIQMRLFLLVIWELFYHIEWWYQFFFNLWSIEERFHEIFFFSLPLLPPPTRQPPVSESHWRTLLQDMLTMQQNVYTCLDSDACYEVSSLFLVWEVWLLQCVSWTQRWWPWPSVLSNTIES